MATTNGNGGELQTAFKQKAAFMKTWKPASPPSNRDRLELYALHKQAISGDANTATPNTAAEKAKYNAWKSKTGMNSNAAMRSYITESERQVRVYGNTINALPNTETPETTTSSSSRGLAAIPLLCAAASEQRKNYLRRLQSTTTSWWKRQEPLTTVNPSSLLSVPEKLLLGAAGTVESLGIAMNTLPPPITNIGQSLLWPLHNCFLAVWMGIIMISSILSAAWQLNSTILLGSKRTGRTLQSIWKDDVQFGVTQLSSISETHQPTSARIIALLFLPYSVATSMLNLDSDLYKSALYVVGVLMTWWYVLVLLPWVFWFMISVAFVLGGCCAIVELATFV